MSEQESTTDNNQSSSTSEKKSSPLASYMIGGLVLAALGGGLWWYMNMDGDRSIEKDNDTAEFSELSYPDVVAKVNGQDVSGTDLAANVTQTIELQGLDINDSSSKQQAEEMSLDALINTELLLQEAATSGVFASDEEIDAQLAEVAIQLGGEDMLDQRLEEFGLTMSELRQDVSDQVTINNYLQQKTELSELTVTDEEVTNFYNTLASQGNGEVPSLELVEDQVRQQLLLQKQQEILDTLVQSLRADANIEILI